MSIDSDNTKWESTSTFAGEEDTAVDRTSDPRGTMRFSHCLCHHFHQRHQKDEEGRWGWREGGRSRKKTKNGRRRVVVVEGKYGSMRKIRRGKGRRRRRREKKRREISSVHLDSLFHQFSFCARDPSLPPSLSSKSPTSLQRLSVWDFSCVQLSQSSFEDIPAAAAPKNVFQVAFMCASVKEPKNN